MNEEICKIIKEKDKLYILVGEDAMGLSKETKTELMKDLEVVFDSSGEFLTDWQGIASKLLNKFENTKPVDRDMIMEMKK